MKKIIRLLSAALILMITVLSACETLDPPDEGDVREKYVATWTCKEGGGMTYPVTITLDGSNSSQVLIANFHYLGNTERAYAIATTNNLTIPSQTVCGNTVNGSGDLVTTSKITVSYTVNDGVNIESITAEYTK